MLESARDAGHGDEADRSRDRERHASRQQRHRAADQRERDAGEDKCGLRDRPEGQEQKNANQQEDQRDDEGQSGARAFEVFELPAPNQVVPLGHRHLRADRRLRGQGLTL